jgi:exonuclease VII small subunit
VAKKYYVEQVMASQQQVAESVWAIEIIEARMIELRVARRTIADKCYAELANIARLAENTQADLNRAIAIFVTARENAMMTMRQLVIVEREIEEKLKRRRHDLSAIEWLSRPGDGSCGDGGDQNAVEAQCQGDRACVEEMLRQS